MINLSRTFITAFVASIGLAACGGGGSSGGGAGGGGAPVLSTTALNVANAGTSASLTATATDADGDPITYTWNQISGPDLIDLSGVASNTVTFTAPATVSSLVFEVVASDGTLSDEQQLTVVVTEEGEAIFVDGNFTGSSDGSIERPFTNLADAIEAGDELDDFYLADFESGYSLEGDDITLSGGQSLYGGFGDNWKRDTLNRTRVNGDGLTQIRHDDVNSNTTISGFDFQGVWLEATGSGRYVVENNSIVLSDVPLTRTDYLSNVAVVSGVSNTSITDNFIDVGNAGMGVSGTGNSGRGIDGASGNSGGTTGAPGFGGGNGGDGGAGGGFIGNETAGADNGLDGSPSGPSGGGNGGQGFRAMLGGSPESGGTGDSGANGSNGVDGSGGRVGGLLIVTPDGRVFSDITTGGNGQRGVRGLGGGGGGGGGEGFTGDGGGGGGGGGGGFGGGGGMGGIGGGLSIGIVLTGSSGTNEVVGNQILIGDGGSGGIGSNGAVGGAGGTGGSGGTGNGSGASGGQGGNGGNGGSGGAGGGGAGGSSYGIYLGTGTTASIEGNTIDVGNGGEGEGTGEDGESFAVFDGNLSDGFSPALGENTVSFNLADRESAESRTAGILNDE